MNLKAEFAIPTSASQVTEWECGGGGGSDGKSGGEFTNIQEKAARTITSLEEQKMAGRCLQSEASLASYQEEAGPEGRPIRKVLQKRKQQFLSAKSGWWKCPLSLLPE